LGSFGDIDDVEENEGEDLLDESAKTKQLQMLSAENHVFQRTLRQKLARKDNMFLHNGEVIYMRKSTLICHFRPISRGVQEGLAEPPILKEYFYFYWKQLINLISAFWHSLHAFLNFFSIIYSMQDYIYSTTVPRVASMASLLLSVKMKTFYDTMNTDGGFL